MDNLSRCTTHIYVSYVTLHTTYITLLSEGIKKTVTLRKLIKDLAKNFYSKIYDFPNDIGAELPDYEPFQSQLRKRPKYSIIAFTPSELCVPHI